VYISEYPVIIIINFLHQAFCLLSDTSRDEIHISLISYNESSKDFAIAIYGLVLH